MPVGIFDKLAGWITPGTGDAAAGTVGSATDRGTGLASPWATGRLSRIELADIFGLSPRRIQEIRKEGDS